MQRLHFELTKHILSDFESIIDFDVHLFQPEIN